MTEIELSDPACRVQVRTRRGVRRFTLRLTVGGGGAVLTQPPGVPAAETRAFLDAQAGWLRDALARQGGPVMVQAGAVIPVDGQAVTVMATPGHRGGPALVDGTLVVRAGASIGRQVAAWLKMRARDRLVPASAGYAAALGCRFGKVSLRDTRSRWGSCSSTGNLSFSWRLAMAPPEVQDYVAAHEVAHLREMNHSARFWALLDGLMPGWQAHRLWLRQHGRGLHAYRFD